MTRFVEGLRFLLGTFDGVEAVHESAWTQGGPATSVVTGRSAVSGGVLLTDYRQHRDGVVSFEVVSVYSTDPDSREVLVHSFDTVGFPPDPPARGTWHGEDLVLDRVTPRGSSRTVLTPMADGYRRQQLFRPPGAGVPWQPVLDSCFTSVTA